MSIALRYIKASPAIFGMRKIEYLFPDQKLGRAQCARSTV